jgi:hypothetical protein
MAVADAAFFVDAARPITQMRLRYDAGFDFQRPDRAEFFMAREAVNQQEPSGPCTRHGFGRGPAWIASKVDYESLSLYTEAATGSAGISIEMPYVEIDPETSAISPNPACGASNFGDMVIGTKALLLDCELLQLTSTFKTFIPVGNFTRGIGTGHISLEPGFLATLKLSSSCYLQAGTAYWISVGGDDLYQGNVWENHLSFNKVLWCPCHDFQVIGTAELNEWTVFGGNYTNTEFLVAGKPVPVSASSSMCSMGPGIRGVLCDKFDAGVGTAFSVTGDRWTRELIRAEFRMRF